MSKYLLDSDVIIWFLRGRAETRELLLNLKDTGIPNCSALSVAEIIIGERPKERKDTRQFLQTLNVLPFGFPEAKLTGELVKEYKTKGKVLSFVDTAIASTCLLNNLILVTYNPKDFPMPELKKLMINSSE